MDHTSSRLAYFEVIIALGPRGEFGLGDSMPWGRVKEDLQYFSRITTESEKKEIQNAIIMGRKTFETLNCKPLPNRLNVVISETCSFSKNSMWHLHADSYLIFPSLDDALKELAKLQDDKQVGKVFVIGGAGLAREGIFHESCESLHVTEVFPIDWKLECDLIFSGWNNNLAFGPDHELKDPLVDGNYRESHGKKIVETRNTEGKPVKLCFRRFVKMRHFHPENAYLDLLQRIMQSGTLKTNRTGISTLGVWGEQVRFDLTRFPLITSRRIFFRGVVEELLLFLSGRTQSTVLESKGVNVWKKNTCREFLDKRGLTQYQEGDMGKSYPFQWRHFGAECRPNEQLELGQGGIDQIKGVVEDIRKVKENPEYEAARRLLVTAWNPTDIKKMALPCCHDSFQFQVDGTRLNCLFRMRSSDTPVGLPWNIAFYALLTYMIGHITDLQPGTLVASLSDAHIYTNCLEQVREQLSRSPRDWPKLEIVGTHHSIDDFRSDSFKLNEYHPHKSINMEMAT